MYKIEKNIPVAKLQPSGSKYPFTKMEVGDSFFVKGDLKKRQAVAVAVYNYKLSNKGIGFCTRTNDEGIRVWRTA